ncbi:MAG: T9SS type A sorting domain-containing protein, partial [Ignavibacteria bacterium]|nr:T9SS type A sorting domain-containing protein [Ignavibacteria bacterium]
MKKLFIFILLMGLIQVSQAQKLIQSFDNAVGPFFLDPPVLNDNFYTNGPGSYCLLANDTSHVEGTGSMKIDYHVQASDGWGGYVVRTTYTPGATDALPYMDLSGGTHLRLRYKVPNPALMTAAGATTMELKMAEIDAAGLRDLWLHKINIDFADATGEWIDVDIPLELNADNSKGFVWQLGEGDKELQLENIKGFEFALVYATTGGDTAISSTGSVLWDNLTLEGKKSVPTVFFAGKALPNALGVPWAWGNSTIEMVQGAGKVPELNALKWVQGYNPDWGLDAGYTGWGCSISPAFDMSWSWDIDTLKFWMKSEDGVDTIRVQLEGGGGKVGALVKPISDNQWHQYFVALKDLIPQDNTTGFTNASVGVFGIMAQNNGITGKVIYVSEIWTGNPKIDVVAPKAVTGLSVVPGTYSNLVTWTDVPNETGEAYDVYYSDKPISDIANAKLLKGSVAENTQIVEQILKTPNTDQPLTYYYAIVCKDAFVNFSPPAFYNTPTTNNGKGVPTIAKTAPANFAADGDLSEWTAAAVPEIRIIRSEGTGFDAPSGLHDGDADYSIIAYLAVDADYLYVAGDVTDDIYSWKSTNDPWMNDAVSLFLGLFDANTTGTFTSYKRGATPHYEMRFDEKRVTIGSSDSLLYPGPNYYFGQKSLSSGYYFEAKISLVDIATKRNYGITDKDEVFHPVEGMQIPIDFSCNDADATGSRELVFCYSPFNLDQSWNNPSLWTATWIGNKMFVDPDGVEDANGVVNSFNLAQNYPNPFNPSTKISYAIQSPELVTLRVFDVLGREVAMLVNQYQSAGNHSVSFDASSLASGMYFYKLEAGSFQSIKKMMLL